MDFGKTGLNRTEYVGIFNAIFVKILLKYIKNVFKIQ